MQSLANAHVSYEVKDHALLSVIRYISFRIIVEYDNSNSITLELSEKSFEHMLYFIKGLLRFFNFLFQKYYFVQFIIFINGIENRHRITYILIRSVSLFI